MDFDTDVPKTAKMERSADEADAGGGGTPPLETLINTTGGAGSAQSSAGRGPTTLFSTGAGPGASFPTPPPPPNDDDPPEDAFGTPLERATSPQDTIEGDNIPAPSARGPATPQRERFSEPMASPELRTIQNLEALEPKFDEGYDSDGNAAPTRDPDNDEFDEEELVAVGTVPEEAGLEDNEAEQQPKEPRHVPIPEDVLKKMTVADLKQQLLIREVQFASNLKKPGLLQRLRESLQQSVTVKHFGGESQQQKKKGKGKKKTTDDMSGFAPGAQWVPLSPDTVVEEPENTIRNARAPTDMDNPVVAVKHNFAEHFDRPIFTGTYQQPLYHANGRQKKDRETGAYLKEKLQRKKMRARRDFMRKHHLSKHSDPVEFFEAFFPWGDNPYGKSKFSIAQLTTYTNLKATLANAGPEGTCYKDFTRPFTPKEIRQYLGLYIWNGLSPSPRVEMKFKSQSDDPVQGCDFINQHFGPNAERRFRHFKCFFACQDPRHVTPDRNKNPLFKVAMIVKWINEVGRYCVDLGENVSIDEQTIGFQGRHQHKLRITYKKEGDGFQCDVLCEDGFTFSVYFRNEPPPTKYTSKGFSPLHARVFWLFDQLRDNFHRVWMDNLYLSAKFARASFTHERKVLIAGVTRKSGRGVPLSVLQEELVRKKEQEAVRGTVKVSVLKNDPGCPDLIAASVYDTKPVHFISMIAECIQWIVKERLVYNVDTGKSEVLRFLRLNVNDDYNNDMGHVDVSDQLRNHYRFDHWLRQYKWWWSVFLWAFGVLLVNAYVCYRKVMEQEGVPPSQWLSHYQFRKAIAVAWVSSDEPSINARRKANSNKEGPAAMETPTGSAASRKRAPSSTGASDHSSGSKRRSTGYSLPTNIPRTDSSKKRTRASVEAAENVKAPALKQTSIDSPSGPFAKRLDRFTQHFPMEPTAKRPKCALHSYAAEIEEKRHVYMCSHCRLHLCIGCFPTFHTQTNLSDESTKQQLAKEMQEKLAAEPKSKKVNPPMPPLGRR